MQDEDTRAEAAARLWHLISGIDIAMLTTIAPDGSLVSRPLQTQKAECDGRLWFMTDFRTHKIEEIRAHPQVNVAYADADDNKYVSVKGNAEVLRDQARIDELWSPAHALFYEQGKDDPNIALLCVTIESAEYWDGPSNRVTQAIGFVAARITGDRDRAGTAKTLEFHGRA